MRARKMSKETDLILAEINKLSERMSTISSGHHKIRCISSA